MGRYYQDLDRPFFDYELQAVSGIPHQLFRGPRVDLSRPYVACIGAAQTFGRFCSRPFPALLSDRLGMQVLNLGVGGAGPRLFLSDQYVDVLNGAEAVVVQVLSARSESNSLFDNRQTGSPMGVRLSDGKRMRFEDFLAELVDSAPPELLRRIVEETRELYVRNSTLLLQRIRRPKVLFWFSTRTPAYQPNYSSAYGILEAFPQLVDAAIIEQVRTSSDAYVESVSVSGIPQTLWEAPHQIDGTILEGKRLVNWYYPSPEMHAEAAPLLASACASLLV